MDNFPVGTMMSFVYNDKPRVGVIDKVGKSTNGMYIVVKGNDGKFKSFSLHKMDKVQVG